MYCTNVGFRLRMLLRVPSTYVSAMYNRDLHVAPHLDRRRAHGSRQVRECRAHERFAPSVHHELCTNTHHPQTPPFSNDCKKAQTGWVGVNLRQRSRSPGERPSRDLHVWTATGLWRDSKVRRFGIGGACLWLLGALALLNGLVPACATRRTYGSRPRRRLGCPIFQVLTPAVSRLPCIAR
ncbi:hypothetical protein PYCCODRAFT_409978 [Trametes coccinea BRFM310]|uniref:Uncharacterized protein n=1 Tax=Trametes coccinea (strain BRFM310) TaxID=1353009 RepID=A0A1Y2I656_TRAC3|nr:hypothetical protein PYCCODRAFT_409978 [Trametes coccinea BRFM310]